MWNVENIASILHCGKWKIENHDNHENHENHLSLEQFAYIGEFRFERFSTDL